MTKIIVDKNFVPNTSNKNRKSGFIPTVKANTATKRIVVNQSFKTAKTTIVKK